MSLFVEVWSTPLPTPQGQRLSAAEASDLTWRLVRRALSQYVPVAPSSWRFHTQGVRAVRFPTLRGAPTWLSVSHTRGYAVCALSNVGPVGIDCEPAARTLQRWPTLLRHLRSEEAAALAASAAPEQVAIALLSLKEALGKAHGKGLGWALRSAPLPADCGVFKARLPAGLGAAASLFTDVGQRQLWLGQAGDYHLSLALLPSQPLPASFAPRWRALQFT